MKLRYFLAVIAFLGISTAYAQTLLQQYAPGPRLIDGSQLNLMVNTVNAITGKAGSAGAIVGTTGTFSGLLKGATLQVNSNACITSASYYFTGTPAATDQVFFVATRAYSIVSISQVHSVAAGGASTLQVTKDTSTNAPGAGTDILTNNTNTGFDLNATANTVQVGTFAATTLAAGDRLAVDFANAIQSSAGVVVTACMAPI